MNFSGDFTCHCGIRPKTAPECNPVTHSLISKWKYSNLFFRVLLLCLIRFWTSLDNIFSLNLRFSSFVGNRTSSLSVMPTSGLNSPSWKMYAKLRMVVLRGGMLAYRYLSYDFLLWAALALIVRFQESPAASWSRNSRFIWTLGQGTFPLFVVATQVTVQ